MTTQDSSKPTAALRRLRTKPRAGYAALAITALLAAGCSTSPDTENDNRRDGRPVPSVKTSNPSPSSSPSPSPSPSRSADAVVKELTDTQWSRMVAANMWRKECPDVRDQLRRVEINYVNFGGKVRRGALVVNADVADSVVRIFTRLFDASFPIRRMEPVENYGGDLNASLRADNTSAFNCRRPEQINAPFKESPHANGRGIDINPLENPWKDLRTKSWSPSGEFSSRTPGKGKILEGGLVWQAFTDEGWIWQNIDVPDYMHFDTGYPSAPYKGPGAGEATSTATAPSPSPAG